MNLDFEVDQKKCEVTYSRKSRDRKEDFLNEKNENDNSLKKPVTLLSFLLLPLFLLPLLLSSLPQAFWFL